ncbi:helix-turn-helix domain-containing protein [Pseudonocardia halophobica]|uniref:helix-turn-helix domain-containing protein n=1 Tax=Pseudonocardia halophobica TaxID=29401 RepID=UPI003D8E1E3B
MEIDRLAENRERQRALYGTPLAERVHRMLRVLGITQGSLAATLGMSPAMLSQLVSAKRVKIGDPAVLARLLLLDGRCAAGLVAPEDVSALLDEVRTASPEWAALLARPVEASRDTSADSVDPPSGRLPSATRGPVPAVHPAARPVHPGADPRSLRPAPRPDPRRDPALLAAEALRRVAGPAQLVAAASTLAATFPELAALLRRAAATR